MKHLFRVVCLSILMIAAAHAACAAERSVEDLLPTSCAQGWVMDERPATYTPDSLYKHINGEAELYLPYGFEQAQTVMYVRPPDKSNGLVANVFKMGSLLDAFGIYGNYRGGGAEPAKIGADGFVEESQVMFYQGRYFVQVTPSGSLTQDASLFLACATAISKNLGGNSEKPRELGLLSVPGLLPLSEKYYADGLLGYGFLGRGLTAEVILRGVRVKALVVLGDSEEKIRGVFDAYVKHLTESKVAPQVSQDKARLRLAALDPLYKGILLQQSGRYAVGVAGLANLKEGEDLLKQLFDRLPKE